MPVGSGATELLVMSMIIVCGLFEDAVNIKTTALNGIRAGIRAEHL